MLLSSNSSQQLCNDVYERRQKRKVTQRVRWRGFAEKKPWKKIFSIKVQIQLARQKFGKNKKIKQIAFKFSI
jgi:hypothetical protein